MSLQASWNTAMGAIAGALHFQDVRERMEQTEERRAAREAARKPSGGTVRESHEGMETEAGRQRIAKAQGEEQQNYENYLTNQYAAQQAQEHISKADTAKNSVSATIQAAKRRRSAPRGLSPQKREELRKQFEAMGQGSAEDFEKLYGGKK